MQKWKCLWCKKTHLF